MVAVAGKNGQPMPHDLEKVPTERQNQYLEELLRMQYNSY
jgi:hypothetical protein